MSPLAFLVKLVATPPPPFMTKVVTDEGRKTVANGMTHSVSHEWSVPNGVRKMLFTLTTAASATARIQALGAAAIIS